MLSWTLEVGGSADSFRRRADDLVGFDAISKYWARSIHDLLRKMVDSGVSLLQSVRRWMEGWLRSSKQPQEPVYLALYGIR